MQAIRTSILDTATDYGMGAPKQATQNAALPELSSGDESKDKLDFIPFSRSEYVAIRSRINAPVTIPDAAMLTRVLEGIQNEPSAGRLHIIKNPNPIIYLLKEVME